MLDNQASKFVAFWYMPTLPKGWEENRRLCVSDVCLHCFFLKKNAHCECVGYVTGLVLWHKSVVRLYALLWLGYRNPF